MLKPVRVLPSESGDDSLKRSAGDLAGTLSFILMGHHVEMTPFEAFCMPVATYLHSYKRKSVLLNIEIESDPTRKIYAFFEFNSAIIYGAIMRQLQEGLIQSKLGAGDFSGPIREAFNEIGNQFTGSLDRIVRSNTHAKAHLVLDFKKQVYPDEQIAPEHFIDNEEYVVWLSDMTIEGYPKQKLTIMFPQSFFEEMIGQRLKLQGINQRKVMLYSWDKEFAKRIAEKVYSRHFVAQLVDNYTDMVHLGKETGVALVCIDLDRVTSPIPHDIKIFAKRMQNAKIPDSVPIWVSTVNPSQDIKLELEREGLRGVNVRDAKKDLLGWIHEQLAKIPVNN